MDFQINLDRGNSTGYMTFAKNTDIRSNIYFSLYINQGDWFYDPTFGSKLSQIRKITDSNILLAKQYTEEALKWLLNTGKASSITVIAEKDDQNLNQINLKVTVIQPNSVTLYYNQAYDVKSGKATFVEVNGPSTHVSSDVWYDPIVSPTQI